MTDGYANGWLIEPAGDGPVSIALTWTPQRIVWAGFVVTGLMIPACIVVYGDRRRRRERTSDASPADEWHASSVGATSDGRRLVIAGLACAAWTSAWWFVAGPLVAAIALGGLVARLATPLARWPLAGGAGLALLLAEASDRPSLVFVGVALALAEIVGSMLRDQGSTSAWNEEPLSSGRGYQ